MADTVNPTRVEPVLEPHPVTPTARAVEELKAAIEATPPSPTPGTTVTAVTTSTPVEYSPPPPHVATPGEYSPPPPPHVATPASSATDTAAPSARGALDQLSRIEDKVARIEEKYARTEFVMQRVQDKVEGAMGRMDEVALQSDLVALRNQLTAASDRIRKVPGFGALMLTGIVTAVLAAALVIAALRFVPGLLVR